MRLGIVTVVALVGAMPWALPAEAAARDQMEACGSRVMARLSKAKASEDKVGPAIVKECDKQLRASLAEAIKTGEAGGCTVESCLALARERATEESTEMYRQKFGSQ